MKLSYFKFEVNIKRSSYLDNAHKANYYFITELHFLFFCAVNYRNLKSAIFAFGFSLTPGSYWEGNWEKPLNFIQCVKRGLLKKMLINGINISMKNQRRSEEHTSELQS